MKPNYVRNIILGILFIGPGFVHGSISNSQDTLKTILQSKLNFLQSFAQDMFNPRADKFNVTTENCNETLNFNQKSHKELYEEEMIKNQHLNDLLKTENNTNTTKINDLEKEKIQLEKNLKTTQENLTESTKLLDSIKAQRQQLSTDMSHAKDDLSKATKKAKEMSSMTKKYQTIVSFTIPLVLILIITNLATLYKLKMAR